MTASTPIDLDGRNRISLNGFDLKSRTYLAREEAGGTIVLEPAVVMSAAEAAYLKNPQVREVVERGLDTPTEDLHPRKLRNRRAR
jgi:hypothetical protein